MPEKATGKFAYNVEMCYIEGVSYSGYQHFIPTLFTKDKVIWMWCIIIPIRNSIPSKTPLDSMNPGVRYFYLIRESET